MAAIRNSLQKKLVLFLLAAIVLPIATSIIVTYFFARTNVKDSYIQENTTLLYQGAANLRNYLERLNQASLLIYRNAGNARSLYNLVEKRELGFADDKELYVNLQYIVNSLAEGKQVHLYSERAGRSYRFAYNLLRSSPGASYAPSFPEGSDAYLEPTHTSHDFGVSRFSFEIEEEVVTIHRQILNQPTDEILGTLSIDIRAQRIREISEMLVAQGEEELVLFDRTGALVYGSDVAAAEIARAWLPDMLASSAASGHADATSGAFRGVYLYESIRLPFAEWYVVKLVPYDVLYRDARRLTLINGSIVLAFLAVAMIAAAFVSLHFTSPIKRLIRYINKVETGQLDAELSVRRSDEIGVLAHRFSQMIRRLNLHINREYRLELANRTNQLRALQAQVNPHFMNNALQSIATLALQKNEKKIYSLIAALGKMMRYQMNTAESAVPLAMEVDYVRAYLALQAQRFEERFAYELEIGETAKRVEVPRMLLQPIVENCFKHGLTQTQAGEIRVTADVDADRLIVVVADNGAGMEPQALEALQARLERLRGGGDWSGELHIGLSNVQSRLQLYYEGAAAMTLEASPGRGMRVRLELPLPPIAPEHAETEGGERP
ncbi:sensor histidine kinase [Paenibacillus sp. IB182496]|uniref:histidine kinase n=1 Tax=Paenibacillus sabuli TaxID=2772509 RepID=A0A927GRF1_9BACL|nr:sensor histidine kinase [Paenibacillus sabuli]MBD2845418.1 sensor histidine kinase [Paenibacillus sabuli]